MKHLLVAATLPLLALCAQAAETETLPSGVKIVHTVVGTGPSPKASAASREPGVRAAMPSPEARHAATFSPALLPPPP